MEERESNEIARKKLIDRLIYIFEKEGIEITKYHKDARGDTLGMRFYYKDSHFNILINMCATKIRILSKIGQIHLEEKGQILDIANDFNFNSDFYLCSMVIVEGELFFQSTIYINEFVDLFCDANDIKKVLFAVIDEIVSIQIPMTEFPINDNDLPF
jgi:hypothetical protein